MWAPANRPRLIEGHAPSPKDAARTMSPSDRKQKFPPRKGGPRRPVAGEPSKPGGPRPFAKPNANAKAGAGAFTGTRKDAANPAARPERQQRPPPRKGGPRRAVAAEASEPGGPMRIAKAMARAGLCSRREAERWIAEGRVSVNGEVLKSPARDVKPGDDVKVDGQVLPTVEPPRLWRYYKPKGLVTTHRDPEGRPTVFDSLPDTLPRVVSIGRLDFNSEGLLLLTNDGALARHLELPTTGWLRRYRVRAHGRITQADLDRLKDGVEVEGVRYGPIEALLDKQQGANVWVTVGLREGKNREVRKILSTLGLEVNRLIRISFGPFQLAELEPGDVDQVKRRVLIDQLGPALSKELGLEAAAEEERVLQREARKRGRVGWGGPSLDDDDL